MDLSDSQYLGPDFGTCDLPAISTPLDALFAQYKKNHDDIERIAAYVACETDVCRPLDVPRVSAEIMHDPCCHRCRSSV